MSGSSQGTRLVGLMLVAASIVSAMAAPGLADKPGLVHPPHESGHRYQVVVAGPGVSCKWAHPYVVKFIAEKIKSTAKFGMPQGSVGYTCTSGIANNGTAYQGGCLQAHPKPGTALTPAFDWDPTTTRERGITGLVGQGLNPTTSGGDSRTPSTA